RDCVVFGVAESDERRSHTSFCGKSISRPRQDQKWFATLFFTNIDVAPAHCFADPGAERFCHCLLARETRSQMALWEFHRHRIFNLTVCENATQKAISKSLDGMLDAGPFDTIDANANYAHFVRGAEPYAFVGRALRLPCPEMATEAVALQFCRRVPCS